MKIVIGKRNKAIVMQFMIRNLLLGLFATTAGGAHAVTLDEVGTGELLFTGSRPNHWVPAPQLEAQVDIQVSGLVARVTVEQRFFNPSDEWVAGRYVFPLPETAAVNDMRIQIGERIIIGEIHEKKAAKEIFRAAKRAGKRAALTEQHRANLFSTQVANIAPQEEITISLTYLEKISFERGRFSLRFPMTITPRYFPGGPQDNNSEDAFSEGVARTEILSPDPLTGWAAPTAAVPDADQISPFLNPQAATPAHPVNPVRITATIDAGLPLANVASPWHDIQTTRDEQRYRIELADGPVSMDRDFELTWQPAASAKPQAAIFSEQVADAHYALLMVMPPAQMLAATRIDREAIFIIDTSGSMGGEPIRQARQALLTALDSLEPTDRFNIIAFNDQPTRLFANAEFADGAYVQNARKFIKQLQAGGGTEMARALRSALQGQSSRAPADASDSEQGPERLRQVIFITDGAVGNEDALFRLIDTGLGNNRLFTVGIGAAPNSYFMRKAAQFGRGTFTFIGSLGQVEEKMGRLFSQLESPVLRNIDVQWPANAEFYPPVVPDLYSGQPLVVAAKLAQSNGTLAISGSGASSDWRQQIALDSSASHPGIATLWARDKIAALSDEIIAAGESDSLRLAILETALPHRLVSRYTSFVAVEQQPARPSEDQLHSKNVPNARPHGQSPQPYAYPQTATTAIEKLWLGLLSFVFAGQLWFLRRRGLARNQPALISA